MPMPPWSQKRSAGQKRAEREDSEPAAPVPHGIPTAANHADVGEHRHPRVGHRPDVEAAGAARAGVARVGSPEPHREADQEALPRDGLGILGTNRDGEG